MKPRDTKVTPAIPHLIVVHGEKGGVGKSTVARLLAAWLEDRGQRFVAYDGDPMTRDFARFRAAGETTEVEIDNTGSIRTVLDRLMGSDPDAAKVALIDLSAGAGADLAVWLESTRALKAAGAGRLKITVVFVVGATRTSVDKLAATHRHLAGQVSWVVALNKHLTGRFELYEASDVRRAVKEEGAIEIAIPSLDTEIYQAIDKLQIPFRVARDDVSKLGFSFAGTVDSFLEVAYYEFDGCAELLGLSGGK